MAVQGGKIEEYRILSTIEESNYAIIYKTQNPENNTLALKIARRKEFNEIINREFSILSQFHHPHIVEVYDYGTTKDGRAFFTLEYIDGQSINKYFKGYSKELLSVLLQVIETLGIIHEKGFVHSDLKPEHILYIPSQKKMILIDFGFAQLYSIENKEDIIPAGTIGYIAPEALKGIGIDGRADLYSFGVIVHEILAGEKPKQPFKPIQGITKELNTILARLVSHEPAIRPSIIELHIAMSKYLGATTVRKPSATITLPKTSFVKITEIYNSLLNARSKAITIFGDTGAGKTRLLKELRFKFLMDDRTVLLYAPQERHNFLDILCRFIGFKETNFSQYEDKFQIYDEILDRLHSVAKKKHLVIIIDDAESLTNYEAYLLRYIGYGTKNTLITVINASKPNKKIQNLGFEQLTLRPFTTNETRELLEKTFLKIEPLLPFAEWLHEQSGGNPLFIVEILNTLFDKHLLYYQSGEWRIENKLLSKVKIPKKIERLLQKRLKNLNNNEQKILKITSLCDIPIDIQILNLIMQAETYSSIECLKNHALLKEMVINNRVVYAVPNKILKTITTDSLIKKEKQPLQHKLVTAIAKLYPHENTFVPCLAELYNHLGKKKQASLYYLKAAHNTEKIYDYESALVYYERYAQCIKKHKHNKYLQTLIKIANINHLMGNNKIAIDQYKKILTFKKIKLNKQIYLRLGNTYSTIGDHKQAVIYYKKTLSHIKTKNTREYIKPINFLGYSMLCLNKFKKAELLFNKSLDFSKNINDLKVKAESQYYQAVLEWFRHDYDKGIIKAKENLEFTKKNKLQKQYAYTANLLSSFYQHANNIKNAQKFLDIAISGFKKIKHINSLCGALNEQAFYFREQADIIKSKDLFHSAFIQAQQIDNNTIQYVCLINLAHISEYLGNFDDAISYYEKASAIYPNKTDHVFGIIKILYKKGEIEKAKKTLLKQKDNLHNEILYYSAQAMLESGMGQYKSAGESMKKGLNKMASIKPDTEIKIEVFLCACQTYYEKGDFKKSLDYAQKLKKLKNPLSRDYIISTVFIKINNYNLKKTNDINISKENLRFDKMGCIYDWAWIRKERIASLINRGIESTQIKPTAQDLAEIEEIFKTLGAHLELNRTKKIQEQLYPIIVKDYSQRVISAQYLETLAQLAVLINQHLGDDDFIQKTLDLIIKTTGAERGGLFIKQEKGMVFVAGRNIDRTTIKDARELSQSAIKALQKDQIIFSMDTLEDPNFSSKKSVLLHQIRSLLCIPLVITEHVIGAIYLDSRIAKEIFGPQDKKFLVTVSQILASIIDKSMVFKKISDENILLKSQILQEIGTGYLMGKSKRIIKTYKLIDDVAPFDSPVLISGETGTGKGMIARYIHLKSPRKDKKFLSINCGTVTETLFESELFGHKKGSFTGAINDKKGLLEEAQGGTVFLDEITNTSTTFQAKLLQAIEEKVIRRVGETKTRKIEVRFLFATNKDLDIEVEDGRFRKDLFYRINVFGIEVPPLREREVDIPLLARFFLEKYCKEINKHIDGFSAEALTILKKHIWPGNVRELQNVIERTIIQTKDTIITPDELGLIKKREIALSLKEIKKEAIIEALQATNWHIQKAAQMLNISRKTIQRHIKQYKIKIKQ